MSRYYRCIDCDHFERDPKWPGFTNGCPDCEIRQLAHMDRFKRHAELDYLERMRGYEARLIVEKRIREIRKLMEAA